MDWTEKTRYFLELLTAVNTVTLVFIDWETLTFGKLNNTRICIMSFNKTPISVCWCAVVTQDATVNTNHCPRLLLPQEPKCWWSRWRYCVVGGPRGQRVCTLPRAPVPRHAELTIRYDSEKSLDLQMKSFTHTFTRTELIVCRGAFIAAHNFLYKRAESGHKDSTASPFPDLRFILPLHQVCVSVTQVV